MPFQSKKQWKKFFAMENRGELPKGEADKWAHETKKSYRNLPTYKHGSRKYKRSNKLRASRRRG